MASVNEFTVPGSHAWAFLGRVRGVECGVTCLFGISALSHMGPLTFLGDRLSHFSLYWAILALWLVAWAFVKKRWIPCGTGGILFLVYAIPVASFWLPDRHVSALPENAAELTVASANLYVDNARKTEALAKVMELSPDVLVLMEVGTEWQPVLKPVLDKYAHTVGTEGGTWLLSRHPLRMARQASDGFVEATVMVPGSPIRVVAVHPPTPRGSGGVLQQWNLASDYSMALHRDKDALHRVLIGDLNTTPFSGVFRHILRVTGLRDGSKGWGYHPTWGPRLPKEPILPWIGLPIDHALISDQVLVEARRVEKIPGADHRYQHLKLRF